MRDGWGKACDEGSLYIPSRDSLSSSERRSLDLLRLMICLITSKVCSIFSVSISLGDQQNWAFGEAEYACIILIVFFLFFLLLSIIPLSWLAGCFGGE